MIHEVIRNSCDARKQKLVEIASDKNQPASRRGKALSLLGNFLSKEGEKLLFGLLALYADRCADRSSFLRLQSQWVCGSYGKPVRSCIGFRCSNGSPPRASHYERCGGMRSLQPRWRTTGCRDRQGRSEGLRRQKLVYGKAI